MKTSPTLLLLGAALVSAPLAAQETTVATVSTSRPPGRPSAGDSTSTPDAAQAAILDVLKHNVTAVRPYDARGINVFEMPKPDVEKYAGPRLDIGAAFTQAFQSLSHCNTAAPRLVDGKDRNELITIGAGLPLTSANLVVNAQLAKWIVVSLENYLAARGHEQFYVKGGYGQIDASPMDLAPLNALMTFTTVKVGMFENNFGDTHFRRSDAGQAMYSPFVGNYIVDPFTTEAGGRDLPPQGLGVRDGRGDARRDARRGRHARRARVGSLRDGRGRHVGEPRPAHPPNVVAVLNRAGFGGGSVS